MKPEHAIIKSFYVYETTLWQAWPVICVDRLEDIPMDYPGLMGVPITIFNKLNREQFDVLGISHHQKLESGREPYRRIFIRNLHPVMPLEIDLVTTFAEMGLDTDFEFVHVLPPEAHPFKKAETSEEVEP